MNLEEMQTVWAEMSEQLEKQKKLTQDIIIEMTQQRYKNSLKKIIYPELLGSIICFGMAILLIVWFDKLDTWPLRICGIISLIVLIVLPVLSLRAIKTMTSIHIGKDSYKKTLATFTRGKKQFMKLQKTAFYTGFTILITMVPVFGKFFNGTDIFSKGTKFWFIYFIFGIAFFILFTRQVIRVYGNSIRKAGAILNDLNEEDMP